MGERDASFPPHVALDAAVEHSAAHLGLVIELEWLATPQIAADPNSMLTRCSGLWAAPGSLASVQGALAGIKFARESATPLFGTCGGFQHAVLEFARNVLKLADATHEAYEPSGSRLLVTALACSIKGQAMPVRVLPGSRAHAAYGCTQVVEEYYCSHGINPQYESLLQEHGLSITARDFSGEPRILEIVPQTRSTRAMPHALVSAFLTAAAQHRGIRHGSRADLQSPVVTEHRQPP